MGEAKRRGTLEQRRQAAVDESNRIEKLLRGFLGEVVAAEKRTGLAMLPTRHLLPREVGKLSSPARLVMVRFDELLAKLQPLAADRPIPFIVGPGAPVEVGPLTPVEIAEAEPVPGVTSGLAVVMDEVSHG